MSPPHRWMLAAAALSLAAGTLSFFSGGVTSRDDDRSAHLAGRARLVLATRSLDGADTLLGATEDTVHAWVDTVALAWEAPDAGHVRYVYQVTTKPFPGGFPKREVPRLVDVGTATPGSFTVAVSDFVQPRLRRTRDYFVRIVPVIDGIIVGPASNTVVLHYTSDFPSRPDIIEDWDALLGERNDTSPPSPTPRRDSADRARFAPLLSPP